MKTLTKKMLKKAAKTAVGKTSKSLADFDMPIPCMAFNHSDFYEWMNVEFEFNNPLTNPDGVKLSDLEDFQLNYNDDSHLWDVTHYYAPGESPDVVNVLFSFPSHTDKTVTLIYQFYCEIFRAYLALFNLPEESEE